MSAKKPSSKLLQLMQDPLQEKKKKSQPACDDKDVTAKLRDMKVVVGSDHRGHRALQDLYRGTLLIQNPQPRCLP